MSEQRQNGQRSTGTIATFFRDRNYGFIKPTGGGGDIYFQARDTEPGVPLRRGIVVSYTTTDTARGRQALDVIVEDDRAVDSGIDEQRYTSLDELKATLVTETTEAGSLELRRPTPEPASSPHHVQDKQ